MNLFALLVVGLSFILQLASAFLALRFLLKEEKKILPAAVLSAALLMSYQRSIPIRQFISGMELQLDLFAEVAGCITSLFFLAGLVYFSRFREYIQLERDGNLLNERTLKETTTRLEALINAIPDMVIFKDVQGRHLVVNKAAEKFIGRPQHELAGKANEDLLPPDIADVCRKSDEKAMNSPIPLLSEEPVVGKDGRTIYLETIKAAFHDETGNLKGMVALSRDVTGRKQSEENILRLSRQKELILNAAGEGIFGIDRDGRITFINPAAATMIGWSVPELIGGASHHIFHHSRPDGSLYPAEHCPSHHSVSTGAVHQVKDDVFWRKDGTSFPVEYTSTPITEDNRITGAVVVFRDISERKQIEEALKAAVIRANQEKAKSQSILAAVGDGINIQDTNYRILYQNEVSQRFYGYHIGEYCYKAFQNRDQACERCQLTMAFNDGKVHTLEQKRTTEEGVRHYEITASPLRDAEGTIVAGIELVREATERKLAEEALRAAVQRASDEKAKSEAIISAIGDSLVVVDRDFRIIYQNQVDREIMGNVVGEICYKVFEGRDTVCDNCPVDLSFRDGLIHRAERTAMVANLGTMHLDITASPLRDESGKVIAVVEMVRDITERKKNEESLLLFRNLLDRSNDAIFVNDPATGRFLAVNEKACSSLGYGRDELLGLTTLDIEAIFPDQATWDAHVLEVRNNGHLIVEGRNKRHDGTWFPVEVNVTYLTTGGQDYMLAVTRDITERKRAEVSLRESEQRFRGAFENAAVGASMVDLNGRFIKVNRFLCEMLGYTEAELLSKTFSDVTHPDDIHVGLEYLKRMISGELDSASFEKRYIRKDGSVVYIIVSPAIIRNGPDAPQYFVGLFQNVTERKKLLEQLEHLNRNLTERVREETEKNRTREQLLQLQSRQAAMGEMIDNIAHQWRQPLNNLGLIVQGLLKKFDSGSLTPDRIQEQAKIGMSLIRYMSQTINDFTNFFRNDKDVSRFRVADVVSTALSFMETSLKRNGIAVVSDVSNDVTVRGYRNEYTQVLINILNNARDVFIERDIRKGTITLSAFQENHTAILTIADNGGGIFEQPIDRIFQPYVTSKAGNKGTGIGLYMSKMIIENNMHGRLSARNKNGGAEFRIEVRNGD